MTTITTTIRTSEVHDAPHIPALADIYITDGGYTAPCGCHFEVEQLTSGENCFEGGIPAHGTGYAAGYDVAVYPCFAPEDDELVLIDDQTSDLWEIHDFISTWLLHQTHNEPAVPPAEPQKPKRKKTDSFSNLRELAQGADRFVVVDTETTGLTNNDRILEIAILTLDMSGNITDRWETLIQPERDVGPVDIHGVCADMVLHAPLFKEIAGDIAARLDGACIVGHNVSFDVRMLRNEFDRLPSELDAGKSLDTRSVYSGKLKEACEAYSIPLEDHHCAAADAEATAKLFLSGIENFDAAGTPCHASVQHRPTGRQCLRSQQMPFTNGGCDQAEAYLRLLNESLDDDGIIDAEEKKELAALAKKLKLSMNEVDALRMEKVSRKIDEVLEDGVLTEDESEELDQIVAQCRIGSQVAQRRTKPFVDPGNNTDVALVCGDEIVVTGTHTEHRREDIHDILVSRGFTVGKSVTKTRTKLLLAASVSSESSKARNAVKWGIPVLPLAGFEAIFPTEMKEAA